MNLAQTSKMTGIPEFLLIRLRARETTSLRSGPPYCKVLTKNGDMDYVYDRKAVREWMKMRRCLITAGDAAKMLGMSREDLLKIFGQTRFYLRTKEYYGKLIINNSKNIYIWLPREEFKK